MLCRMINLKISPQLMDPSQTLHFLCVDAIPYHLQIHMNIAVNRIAQNFGFFCFKHNLSPSFLLSLYYKALCNYNKLWNLDKPKN